MGIRKFLERLANDQAGASVLEFAIGAPLLVGGLLLMTDVGIAISERMEMDRSVRAGAQAAMSLINDTTIIQGLVEESAGNQSNMSVNVALSCLCGAAAGSCNALCGSGEEPSVYVDIIAEKPYDGMLLGTRTLNSSTSVQVR